MEPALAPQPNTGQMPDMQAQPIPQSNPLMEDKVIRNFMQPQKNNVLRSCLTALIPIVLIIIFIFFGGTIFGFFHIENVYHFIISLFIILIIYIITLIVSGMFIKYPTDILSIVLDRLKN